MGAINETIVAPSPSEKLSDSSRVAQPATWAMTAIPKPHTISDFEGVLLAIAGHDLRQPLQVVQSAHELLGLGIRTNSEPRYLRSGQNAIDRLKEQLGQILLDAAKCDGLGIRSLPLSGTGSSFAQRGSHSPSE